MADLVDAPVHPVTATGIKTAGETTEETGTTTVAEMTTIVALEMITVEEEDTVVAEEITIAMMTGEVEEDTMTVVEAEDMIVVDLLPKVHLVHGAEEAVCSKDSLIRAGGVPHPRTSSRFPNARDQSRLGMSKRPASNNTRPNRLK